MLTPDHIETVRVAGQAILYNQKDFQEIMLPTEHIAARASDDWLGARIRNLPVRAAFAHAMASQAITIHEPQSPNFSPPGNAIDAYGRYLVLTEGIDELASRRAVADCQALGGTFTAARHYFEQQMNTILEFERTNPQIVQQRGKVAKTAPTDHTTEQRLIAPMTTNARGTTMSIIIGEALRTCLHQGELAPSAGLSQQLRAIVTPLADLTRLPSSVFHQVVATREVAQQGYRQIKKENDDSGRPQAWQDILWDYLKTGDISPAVYDHGQQLRFEASLKPTITSQFHGLCTAQFWLQSYERPETPGLHQQQARDYFAQHGLVLVKNRFRVADYQLHRAIDVAEQTIFAEPECRLALESLAQHIVRGAV